MAKVLTLVILFFGLFVCYVPVCRAQSTEFAYQGSLKDGANPANGNYDFEFRLYDAASVGNQIGVTVVARNNVAVANGIFSVAIDFGSPLIPNFPGADRFLDVRVRVTGGGAFTPLAPRNKVGSSPYALQSLNAANATNAVTASNATNATNATTATTANNSLQLGGVAANQYVLTGDARLSDARNPLPGSTNYIRNSGAQQQAGASFWISGSGNFGGAGNFDSGLSVGGNFIVGGNTTLTGNLTVNGTLTGNLPAGDTSYVQNRATAQPGTTNFNISGIGTANIFNASTQFSLGGARFFSNPGTQNTFAGINTGLANTGADNSFFGFNAGNNNTSGADNTFIGSDAGGVNTTGANNSFFGSDAGDSNTTGSDNSFFGRNAGSGNTIGILNSFFGLNSGLGNNSGIGNSFYGANSGSSNTTGSNNSFFGRSAGTTNAVGTDNAYFGFAAGQLSTASGNSFFGSNSGDSNSTGADNSFFGADAGQANTTANGNSFFGRNAGAANTIGIRNVFFGRSAGAANVSGNDNSFVGYVAGDANTGNDNSFFGSDAGGTNTSGSGNTFLGSDAGDANTTGSFNTIIGSGADVSSPNLSFATAIGSGAAVGANNTIVLGRTNDAVIVPGRLQLTGTDLVDNGLIVEGTAVVGRVYTSRVELFNFMTGGLIDLCRNGDGVIGDCSSSLRYKTDVRTFTSGLDVVRSLRPITFTWINNKKRDVGFAAEEVAAIEPLLATYDEKGVIDGVKYKQISTVLVNAVNEQQTQIEAQQKQIDDQNEIIKQQRADLEALKALVCSQNPSAAACKQ